ncbi:MAG TPA: hypothetical protein VFI65_05315 [Streptosporangiaceae bacterium]|nr:hypothetical protein [Streptosporangiaceae bacterium]
MPWVDVATGSLNLTAILDVNRHGQRGETRHGWDTDQAITERLRLHQEGYLLAQEGKRMVEQP